MCTQPIYIFKPEFRGVSASEFYELTGFKRDDLSPEFMRNYMMPVPCGKCEDCANRKQHDFYFRAIHEYQNNKRFNGFTLFCTFTFRDNDIPHHGSTKHFDKKLVQDWLHDLNMKVRRYSNMLVRYVFVSELGGLTHRPHHHALLFFYAVNPDYDRYNPSSLPYVKRILPFTSEVCDMIDLVHDSWKFGIADVKECKEGGVQYVCKYVGKDVCNDDPLEGYVLHLRILGYRKYFRDYQRHLSFKRTLNRWFHRFGCFSLLSQGIGRLYEDTCSNLRRRVIEKPVDCVTGFTYAIPRYYVDRLKRADLRSFDCERQSEIPVTSRLSNQCEVFHLVHSRDDFLRTYNKLPDDLKNVVNDTMDEMLDRSYDAPWTRDVIRSASTLEKSRKSKGRVREKMKRECKKIEQKASLVQRGGYKMLNEYKSLRSQYDKAFNR